MAVVGRQITVGSTATLLTSIPADNQAGATIQVANRHATNPAFLGAAGVTTSTGYELKVGETLQFDLGTGDALYGVATVTGTVHVLETGM